MRLGIRRLLSETLKRHELGDPEVEKAAVLRHIAELRACPIAIQTRAANEQHYEVPPRFFELLPRQAAQVFELYFPRGDETLDAAEERMLELYAERAELADGHDMLELGAAGDR